MRDHTQSETLSDTSKFWLARGLFAVLLMAAWYAGGAGIAAAADGAALFEAKCAACHSVGGGQKFGPDLKDVVAKRGKEWTASAIMDPKSAGLGPSMPMLGVSQPEAEAITAYLQGAQAGTTAAKASADAAAGATPEEIRVGQRLFEGRVRFANGGPACNACHHVNLRGTAGGGILAADLTDSFERAGAEGLTAMLTETPFPVMLAAYDGKALTPAEIRALVGFLQHARADTASHSASNQGWSLFSGGVGGVIVLTGFFSLIGGRRKKRCVNQDIYDRQLESE